MKCKKTRRIQAVYDALMRSKLAQPSPGFIGQMQAMFPPHLLDQTANMLTGGHLAPSALSMGIHSPVSMSGSPLVFTPPPVASPTTKNLIQEMLDVEDLVDMVDLKGLSAASNGIADPVECLTKIGDEIVEKLVGWTKKLPFYGELPVQLHTQLLTERWAELVLLNTLFLTTQAGQQPSLEENLALLQERLSRTMHKPIPLNHLRREVGSLLEKLTALQRSFKKLNLSQEAFVCVKAITFLNQGDFSYLISVTPNISGMQRTRMIVLLVLCL